MSTITIDRAVVDQTLIPSWQERAGATVETLQPVTTIERLMQREIDALRAALQSQAASAPVATMVFPKHSPDKPFIALGDCANLYPDAAQTKPLYTTPPATHATLQQALDDLDMVAGWYGKVLHPSDVARVKRSADALRRAMQSQATPVNQTLTTEDAE